MMSKSQTLLFGTILSGFMLASFQAGAIETKARNMILMDYDTGQYLYAKDADKKIPPASMSKLMTIYILFSKLKDGSLSLDDTFTVC